MGMTKKINVLILAAGFGTRLKEAGRAKPKALIETKDGSLLDRLVRRLPMDTVVGPIVLVTNGKFRQQFEDWNSEHGAHVKIITNGILSPEHRLGAIGDMLLASEQLDQSMPTLVCASDTYFEFELKELLNLYEHHQAFVTAVYPAGIEKIRNRLGCVTMDQDRVAAFEEKPVEPQSKYAAVPFYVFPPGITDTLEQYGRSGRSMDAPGYLIPWLLERNQPVFAFKTDHVVDVGTTEDIIPLQ